MNLTSDAMYRALSGRDTRFDGRFYAGITTTGIYCRPSCPARTPQPANVQYFRSAAAAHTAGFRACLRCRPDAAPGSPEWNERGDVTARAVNAIEAGELNTGSVDDLAARLGYSARHLNRILTDELGAGPTALGRAKRANTARILIESTTMPFTQIAYAAGFGGIRQFNDTIKELCGRTPSELRQRAHPAGAGLTVRIPYRTPYDTEGLFTFLAARALPGVETATPDRYRRVIPVPHGTAIATIAPGVGHLQAELSLADIADLTAASYRIRRLFDADADPVAIDAVLADDPALAPSVVARPGLRVPGAVDGFEATVRAIIGQQVSVSAARTIAARLAAAHGEPVVDDELTHAFPSPAVLAEVDDSGWGMPATRRATIKALAATVASGDLVLDPTADRDATRATLLAIPGIGPWTVAYVAMRALGDPDAFLATDLGARNGAANLGLPSEPAQLAAYAERWRPFRSYALLHLWAAA